MLSSSFSCPFKDSSGLVGSVGIQVVSFEKMIRAKIASVLPVFPVIALASCGYHYESERAIVTEGQLFKNGQYRLDRVTESSVTISGSDGEFRAGWELETRGQRGEVKIHSLGNNQHLTILSTEPESKSAELEWSWLDWVGPLTMPPF